MNYGLVTALCCAFLPQAQAGFPQSQSGGTIVQFTASWCEPCQQVKPAINRLAQDGWEIKVVDVDQDRHTAELFRVQNLPTIVFAVNGREVDRIVGVATDAALRKRASRVATRFGVSPKQPGPNYAGRQSAEQSSSAAPQQNTSPLPPASQRIVRGQGEPAGSLGRHNASGQPALLASNGSAVQPAVAEQSLAAETPSKLSLQEAVTRAQRATVRIRVDELKTTAFGTGTVVDVHGDEALVLTCGHLFRHMTPGSQLTVDLYNGNGFQTLPARLIDFMAPGEDSGALTEDIGLISFKTPVAIEPVPILPAAEPVQPGQGVFSFGCDHGDDPTRHDTQITRVNRYVGAENVEIHGAPAVGRSGGGLFDQYGRLVGVCNGAQPEDNEGIYAASAVVYKQIKRLGMEHLFAPHSTLQNRIQLASGQSPATPGAAVNHAVAAGQPLALANSGGRPQSNPGSTAPSNRAPANASVTCIIRDAAGQQRVVEIANPDPGLISSIDQHSRH